MNNTKHSSNPKNPKNPKTPNDPGNSKKENGSSSPSSPKVDIFFTTIDSGSLAVMANISAGYVTETNIRFDNNGIYLIESNETNNVLIVANIPKSTLLHYQYNIPEKQYYAGFELKKFQSNLMSIPTKQVCNVYKLDGDDNFFTVGEITLNKDGANKLKTCKNPIYRGSPPNNLPLEPLVKMTAADFSAMCSSLGKLSSKKIEFSRGKSTFYVKGIKYENDAVNNEQIKHILSARSFCNNSPFDDDAEDLEEEDSLVINFALIKPLIKINKICKNGVVHIYMFKEAEKNTLAIKINIGQIGDYSLYFKDS
jgi:hypothetical protein